MYNKIFFKLKKILILSSYFIFSLLLMFILFFIQLKLVELLNFNINQFFEHIILLIIIISSIVFSFYLSRYVFAKFLDFLADK